MSNYIITSQKLRGSRRTVAITIAKPDGLEGFEHLGTVEIVRRGEGVYRIARNTTELSNIRALKVAQQHGALIALAHASEAVR